MNLFVLFPISDPVWPSPLGTDIEGPEKNAELHHGTTLTGLLPGGSGLLSGAT